MEITKVVATVGFNDLAEKEVETRRWVNKVMALLQEDGWKADFIVGDPAANEIVFEDEDCTAIIPFKGSEQVYAKVDGADASAQEWKAKGYPHYPLLTFLLPSEY